MTDLSSGHEAYAAAIPSAQPGWYHVPGRDEIRWRDEQHWTAYRIARGRPGANWFAVEPPMIGYAFGAMFLALGFAQFGVAALSRSFPVTAILMLLLAALWFATGIGASIVRGLPAPQSAPLAFEAVEPLPGRVEAPGAGWYPIAGRTHRWWSGTRWGSYIVHAGRVRPTFTGPAAYRSLLITGGAVVALGVVGVLVGVALLLIVPGAVPTWGGGLLIAGGAMIGVVGAILFPVTFARRAVLLLPERPPQQAPPV
ncbi:hypothetical protein [Leucobacter sp. GX24907]